MKKALLCLSTILLAPSLQAQTSEATLVETPQSTTEVGLYTLGVASPFFSLVELSHYRRQAVDVGLWSVRETYDGAQGPLLNYGRVYGAETSVLLSSPATTRRGFVAVGYDRSSYTTALTNITTGVTPEIRQETGVDEEQHLLSLIGGGRINENIMVGVMATQMEVRRTVKNAGAVNEGVAFTYRVSPQVFYVSRDFEIGVIYRDQLKVSGSVPLQEAGSLAFALQRRTPAYFAGVRMTLHRDNELNELLRDSLSTQLGAEYALNPLLSVGGTFTYTSASAETPPTYAYETIPRMQWSVLARLTASDGRWIHMEHAYQSSPRTADWERGVTYGAFGSRVTTTFALHQEI